MLGRHNQLMGCALDADNCNQLMGCTFVADPYHHLSRGSHLCFGIVAKTLPCHVAKIGLSTDVVRPLEICKVIGANVHRLLRHPSMLQLTPNREI